MVNQPKATITEEEGTQVMSSKKELWVNHGNKERCMP